MHGAGNYGSTGVTEDKWSGKKQFMCHDHYGDWFLGEMRLCRFEASVHCRVKMFNCDNVSPMHSHTTTHVFTQRHMDTHAHTAGELVREGHGVLKAVENQATK